MIKGTRMARRFRLNVPNSAARCHAGMITETSKKPGQTTSDLAVEMVPPVGFEPTHPAPEAGALSPELRGRAE